MWQGNFATEQGVKMRKKEPKSKKTEQILLKFTPEELSEIENTLEIFTRQEFSSRANFIRAAIILGIMELKRIKVTQMGTVKAEVKDE